MKPTLVLYASQEGQTRQIAEHLGSYLSGRGLEARVEEVEDDGDPIQLDVYGAVLLVASVQHGPYARDMIHFVKKHRQALEQLPTACLAVSLAAAGADDAPSSGPRHLRTRAERERATRGFLERTGLHPAAILPVAGALLYTRDGRFARFVMQPIAHDEGLDVGAAPDFEYKAWARLDRFVDDFLELRPTDAARAISAAPPLHV